MSAVVTWWRRGISSSGRWPSAASVTSGFSPASAADAERASALSAATRLSVRVVASQHTAACGSLTKSARPSESQ
jgi:hypothetical protein